MTCAAVAALTILIFGTLCKARPRGSDNTPVRGFADFGIALPHNEIDLGLCALAKTDPNTSTDCSAFARYVWSGYLELQPLRRTPWRHRFLFFRPKLFGGDNIRPPRYTASTAPVLRKMGIGAGAELPKHFELRYTYRKVTPLRFGSKRG